MSRKLDSNQRCRRSAFDVYTIQLPAESCQLDHSGTEKAPPNDGASFITNCKSVPEKL